MHIVSATSSTTPPRPLRLNDWPTAGISRPHGALFPSNSCDSWLYSRSWRSVSYSCWGSLVLRQRCSAPPPLFPGRAGEEKMSHAGRKRGEWPLFSATPGVSQCTHIDFVCLGSEATDGRVQVFLRTKAIDVYAKKKKQNEEKAAEMGRATHQLWEECCFYVGLDLSQVPALILELFSNIIVNLDASKWLVSRKNTSIMKKMVFS